MFPKAVKKKLCQISSSYIFLYIALFLFYFYTDMILNKTYEGVKYLLISWAEIRS